MSRPFILLDSSMTMHGVRVDVNGGRWDRFKANPILLYMHKRGEVHGKWENLQFSDGQVQATPLFDVDDPDSAKIAGKVERGFLNAASVGLIIHQVEFINDEPWITDYEPYEASIADSGSSANALQLYTMEGDLVEDSEQYIKNLTLTLMSKETKPASEAVKEVEKFPKVVLLALGLDENAENDAATQKINALLSENQTLKLAAQANKELAITQLVEGAFKAKKITDGDKPHYLKLATADFNSTKAILDGIEAPTNLAQFASQGAAKGEVDTTKEDSAEFDRLFKEGGLLMLKTTDQKKFARLFKAYHGYDPVEETA